MRDPNRLHHWAGRDGTAEVVYTKQFHFRRLPGGKWVTWPESPFFPGKRYAEWQLQDSAVAAILESFAAGRRRHSIVCDAGQAAAIAVLASRRMRKYVRHRPLKRGFQFILTDEPF
jgi:hypothetical protein